MRRRIRRSLFEQFVFTLACGAMGLAIVVIGRYFGSVSPRRAYNAYSRGVSRLFLYSPIYVFFYVYTSRVLSPIVIVVQGFVLTLYDLYGSIVVGRHYGFPCDEVFRGVHVCR